MSKDVIVNFFEYDMTPKGVLPIVTVYYSPSDYPEKYVARLWHVGSGNKTATNIIMLADNINEIRKGVLPYTVCFARSPEDDKCVVESWI